MLMERKRFAVIDFCCCHCGSSHADAYSRVVQAMPVCGWLCDCHVPADIAAVRLAVRLVFDQWRLPTAPIQVRAPRPLPLTPGEWLDEGRREKVAAMESEARKRRWPGSGSGVGLWLDSEDGKAWQAKRRALSKADE